MVCRDRRVGTAAAATGPSLRLGAGIAVRFGVVFRALFARSVACTKLCLQNLTQLGCQDGFGWFVRVLKVATLCCGTLCTSGITFVVFPQVVNTAFGGNFAVLLPRELRW